MGPSLFGYSPYSYASIPAFWFTALLPCVSGVVGRVSRGLTPAPFSPAFSAMWSPSGSRLLVMPWYVGIRRVALWPNRDRVKNRA